MLTPPAAQGMPAPPLLACHPTVEIRQTAPLQMTSEALEALSDASLAPVHGAETPQPPAVAPNSCLRFAPDSDMRLPPDSLCVITLPTVYAAPLTWLDHLTTAPAADISDAKGQQAPLCPIIPVRESWPFSAKLMKGTLLFPCMS